MIKFRNLAQILSVLTLLSMLAIASFAQSTSGTVRGTVVDPNGAVVPNAKVTISQKSTNTSQTTQTSDSGEFQFSNLLVGDYVVNVEAANFKKLTLNEVKIQLNQITDLKAQLTVGLAGEVVEVTAGGSELVDTTTANLSSSYSSRQVVELAQTTFGGAGVNNLSLLAANVSSSGGVGVGTGGSVGGQRPRNNNFVVDGVDNNDKSVTGPQSYVSPEEIAEFSLLQNQFSAEYGRSNGGQFISVTKSGTSDYHGTTYGFFRNRNFNAADGASPGSPKERYDYFRGGFNLGGPMPGIFFTNPDNGLRSTSNKVFFFTSYERLQFGAAASGAGISSPTAIGFQRLATIPGLSAVNRGILAAYLPVAPVNNDGFLTVGGQQIPIGTVSFAAPNFFKQNHAVINFDYNQSANTQQRFRFTFTNGADIDNAASLPVFFTPVPSKQRLFSYTLIHNFSSNLVNETRVAFRRSSQNFNVPDFTYPGLDAFPNIDLDDLGLSIGPDGNAPQTGIENNYQLVNNMTWLAGNHSFKFGGDFRQIISPQRFVQRERGDYEYLNLEDFLFDRVPVFAERNVGGNTYYGNQKLLYAFIQDDWRFRPNFTVNLGLNYSYQQIPTGARFQAANGLSSVPGVLVFNAPKTQTKNFAPKVGFAYSPNFDSGLLGSLFGASGKTSIRAGFSMGYDYVFDNLYILSNPPQAQQTIDCPNASDPRCPTANFLGSGGIRNIVTPVTNPAIARSVTSSFIPDQVVPYSLTWTGSIQRQFGKDWSLELRYLGTKGVHLLTQNRINIQAKVAPDQGRPGLPTFLAAPSQATLNALTLDLPTIQARSNLVPRYANAGFTNPVVAFLANGNSIYHGASAQLTKRFSQGLQMTGAYTWSHLIDDTTAEVFSTVLSPRRVMDFQNLRQERANSALDHRHRFVTSVLYELPFFKNTTGFARTLLGGFNIAGTYTYESGEFITIRSGNDSNLNGDSAGDRGIFNPSGTEGIASGVTTLCRIAACGTPGAGAVVGYLATNPNARYIQAGNGAVSTIGRNTFQSAPINNVDFSVFKNFRVTERSTIQYRVDFANVLNHPQYVPGSVNTVDAIGTTGVTQYNQIAPLNSAFLRGDRVFSSNPRVIQMALRWNF